MIRERLLGRGVERDRVPLDVKRDDAKPIRPVGRGRRRLQFDAHLAEYAHRPLAE